MSIPLDRLYQYIDNTVKEITDNVLIYRFYPHGSKNFDDLGELRRSSWEEHISSGTLICYDQEPLDYDYYQSLPATTQTTNVITQLKIPRNNLKKICANLSKYYLLLHSEQRSIDLEKYQNDQFIPIYYWSHALISLDWFRFAQYIKQKKHVSKTFLIYNRAWSNTREYRLQFAELLIRSDLQNLCKTSISPVEPELGIHYDTHQFKNPIWRPITVLENFFPTSTAHSHYSADFDIDDYEATDIEVVLETLFDDTRLHLTEKSLRPIACAQPFILAGTHGSLEYLRSYGFKTFSDVWDESYDQCVDPEERLGLIADLMKQIANWTPLMREQKLAEAQAIADYNKKHFFSQKFFELITNELKINLKSAVTEHNKIDITNNVRAFIKQWKEWLANDEMRNYLEINSVHYYRTPSIKQVENFLIKLQDQYLNKDTL
jgi:hypothetical protein